MKSLMGHEMTVASLAISADDKYLVSGSEDNTIMVVTARVLCLSVVMNRG